MRGLLILLHCLLFSVPAWGKTNGDGFPEVPVLAVSLSPDNLARSGVYVQSQIVLQVRVVSRWPFDELKLRLPSLENVDQIPLLGPRTRVAKTMIGNGYVHEFSVSLFPRSSGSLIIPPISVVGIAVGPDGEIPFSGSTSGQTISVKGISPLFDEPWWLATDRIEMTESWSKPIEEIRFGDIVRRELRVVAHGLTGEQLPVIEHNVTRNIDVSDEGHHTKTELTPSGIITYRTQTWTLKVDGHGIVHIPPITMRYWNTERDIKENVSVRGYRLEPLPRDVEAAATKLMTEARRTHDSNQRSVMALSVFILSPLAAILVYLLWHVLPSRADVRLLLRCRKLGATAEYKMRAVELWAKESGICLSASRTNPLVLPESYLNLRSILFGKMFHHDATPSLARDLVSFARKRRLKSAFAFLDEREELTYSSSQSR